MKVLLNEPEYRIERKRSKFLAIARRCTTLERARELVRETRELYPDCTHVVHAAVVGKEGTLFSSSDDKEPKNTAGRPALEVVKGSGITDICVLIVRWFGGTLLGTGGLVQAYGDSAKGVIALCETEEQIEKSSFTLSVSYSFYKPVKLLLASLGCSVDGEEFGTGVTIRGTVKRKDRQRLESAIADLTGARGLLSFD